MPYKYHCDLTPRAAEAAELVRRWPGIRSAELAVRMGCSPNTARVHLDCARRHGYVTATVGPHGAWWPVEHAETGVGTIGPRVPSLPVASVFDVREVL